LAYADNERALMETDPQMRKEYSRIVHMVENYVRYCQNIGMTGIPLNFGTRPDPPSSFSSLEELTGYLARCRACLAALNRQKPVPGEGNSEPVLVFVSGPPGSGYAERSGETAQGEMAQGEMAQGRESAQTKPLQGKEGELFDRIISSIKLSREDIYLTCAVKCPLPESERPACQTGSQTGRQISEVQASQTSQTIRRCRRLLFQELQLLKPHIICTLDSLATRMVLGKPGSIDEWRGNVFPLQLGESQVKVIPTYSPATILRHSENENRCCEIKKLVWQDMQRIRQEYDQACSCLPR